MLDQETLARIRQIEKELARVELRILDLKDQRNEILQSDPEYGAYVKSYRKFFDREPPLSIRQYYERKAKIDEIDARFAASSNDDPEQKWNEFLKRTIELNRLFGCRRMREETAING